MCDNIIKSGDYVIVQRQSYMKLHKLKEHGTITLGNFIVEMDNVINCKYFETFQMKQKINNKKYYTLEGVTEMNTVSNLNIEKSGSDNRNITDDGTSQTLTKDEIEELKETELSSNCIVEKLINNSKTFNTKTEYSQQKYLKKKEKKYYEYIQIKRPTIRLLSQLFYKQDPNKILGIRIDDLSQILEYSNVQSEGNFLLYDSGTSGLMSAAIINTIGSNTTAKLIHMHPGNECQKNIFLAMQFPEEQRQRCINVNIYSVLRTYYQNDSSDTPPSTKKLKLDEKQKKTWEEENERACVILKNKVDALIVTAKEHPVNIVKELSIFLNNGRALVVFCTIKEPLQELYMYLKSRLDFISLRLTSNFLRNYQVLPERTHPDVNMNSGGFILRGFKISN